MRILAIETTGHGGSVAALCGETLRREVRLDPTMRSAQTLAPAVKQILEDLGWPAACLELVAVVVGPGSFTGLRVGIATAKALAYVAGSAVCGVGTMDVLARQAPADSLPLWTVVDAQRHEIFAARFPSRSPAERPGETKLLPIDDWLHQVRPGDYVSGPAAKAVAARLPSGVHLVDAAARQPLASAVGKIAWLRGRMGQVQSLWNLKPVYYRTSAAEERFAQ